MEVLEKGADIYRHFASRGLVSHSVFAEGFRALGVALDDEMVRELFSKADRDGNGVVSTTEWSMFCEGYPTMVDCLYHKSRDLAADAAHLANVADAEAELQQAIGQEARIKQQQDDARAQMAHLQQRAAEQRAVVDRARQAEEHCQAALADNRARAELGGDELHRIVAKLHQIQADAHANAQRAGDADHRAHQLEAHTREKVMELDNAYSRLRAIEQMLEQQRAVVNRLSSEADEMNEALAHAKAAIQAERQMAADSEREAAGLEHAANETRQNAASIAQSIADAEQALHHAKIAVAKEQQRCAEHDAALAQSQNAEASGIHSLSVAAQQVQAAQLRIHHIKETREDYLARRRQEHDEELALLHQEITLRRQRESLMEKEQMLRQSFSEFHRAPSRVPRPASPPMPRVGRPQRDPVDMLAATPGLQGLPSSREGTPRRYERHASPRHALVHETSPRNRLDHVSPRFDALQPVHRPQSPPLHHNVSPGSRYTLADLQSKQRAPPPPPHRTPPRYDAAQLIHVSPPHAALADPNWTHPSASPLVGGSTYLSATQPIATHRDRSPRRDSPPPRTPGLAPNRGLSPALYAAHPHDATPPHVAGHPYQADHVRGLYSSELSGLGDARLQRRYP